MTPRRMAILASSFVATFAVAPAAAAVCMGGGESQYQDRQYEDRQYEASNWDDRGSDDGGWGNQGWGNQDDEGQGMSGDGMGVQGQDGMDGTSGQGNEDEGNEDEGNEDEGNEGQGNEDQGMEGQGNEDQGMEGQGNEDQGNEDEGFEEEGDGGQATESDRAMYDAALADARVRLQDPECNASVSGSAGSADELLEALVSNGGVNAFPTDRDDVYGMASGTGPNAEIFIYPPSYRDGVGEVTDTIIHEIGHVADVEGSGEHLFVDGMKAACFGEAA